MVHCDPAPPHPPPGEVYNVICFGPPYIDGVPALLVVIGGVFLVTILITIWARQTQDFTPDTPNKS